MKKKIVLLIIICFPCILRAQSIELIKFEDLKSRITDSNDTLYVLNFWATWCKPCIEELPYFEKCNVKYQNNKIKIILVNLDFHSQVNNAAEPFIRKKNIRSTIMHLTDTNSDSWINKVDSSWSGAIPATSMYRNGKKMFFKEGSFTEIELINIIELQLLKY